MRTALRKYQDLPLISGCLVAVNVLVFLVCWFGDGRLYVLGNLNLWQTVINGEYGRIIFAMFLHSDLNHIFSNMLILFFLGSMIEKEIGHIAFTLLYFISGIGGNIASLFYKYLTLDWSASIGASGAVFGLDGALLAMVLFCGRRMQSVTPVRVVLMIVLSLYSGFTGGNIDNAAHIGGLLTGFIVGTVICLIQRRYRGRAKRRR